MCRRRCCRNPGSRQASVRHEGFSPPGEFGSMNVSRQFILRPVATALLMAAILICGAAGYLQLPVSALPQVDYPTIQVLTFFPGAGPDVMASSVTAPLERQFGHVTRMKQMHAF